MAKESGGAKNSPGKTPGRVDERQKQERGRPAFGTTQPVKPTTINERNPIPVKPPTKR